MLEGSNQEASSGSIEALRAILVRCQDRAVSYEEAQEVGESLLDFYELLALRGEVYEQGE